MKSTKFTLIAIALVAAISLSSCNEKAKTETTVEKPETTEVAAASETPDYFLLRPEAEKA